MRLVERGFSSDLAGELAGTLGWWTEAGVDCLVSDAPRDWLKRPDPTLPGTGRGTAAEGGGGGGPLENIAMPEGGTPPSGLRPATSPFRGGFEGSDPLPDQLALFHDWLRASDALPYAAPGAPRVCPAGDPASGLMILVAMPSAEDCTAGTLLTGSAGRLFDRMLAAIGRGRETAYLAGLSCLRSPGGRFDASGMARCAEIARHHVALAEPKALLLLGDQCARAFLGTGAAQARGQVRQIEAGGRTFSAVVTLSPDYLLGQPAAKALAWADLQLLMEILS